MCFFERAAVGDFCEEIEISLFLKRLQPLLLLGDLRVRFVEFGAVRFVRLLHGGEFVEEDAAKVLIAVPVLDRRTMVFEPRAV